MTAIQDRIRDRRHELSPLEQHLAEVVLDHLDDLAVYSAVELAGLSGVSKATVSRFVRRIGYASFAEAKEQARERARERARAARHDGAPVDAGGASPTVSSHLDHEQANLVRLGQTLTDEQVLVVGELLARARRVLVLGFRSSYPVALHLRQQLVQVRDGVFLAPQPGQSVGEELAGLGSRDAVVCMAFRRRPQGLPAVLDAVRETGAGTVLLSEPGAGRLAAGVDHWVPVPVEGRAGFDSYGAAMGAVSLLVGAAGAALARQGRQRVYRISDLYAGLGELEVTAPRA